MTTFFASGVSDQHIDRMGEKHTRALEKYQWCAENLQRVKLTVIAVSTVLSWLCFPFKNRARVLTDDQ